MASPLRADHGNSWQAKPEPSGTLWYRVGHTHAHGAVRRSNLRYLNSHLKKPVEEERKRRERAKEEGKRER